MSDNGRPSFPKRAIVTAGMPYGNKELHFGHIGGVFIPADIFARFLRDRIGKDNVLFISGTDCYGVTIETSYQQAVENGFEGDIYKYVENNHNIQKDTLMKYQISLDCFGSSALGKTGEIHKKVSADIFKKMYERGYLKHEKSVQFYDEEKETFLNGRQVVGRCPIQGCKSERAYADECSLGHQFHYSELINPISVLSGKKPKEVEVENWYFDLPEFSTHIRSLLDKKEGDSQQRDLFKRVIKDYLKQPSIYVKKELIEIISELPDMPKFSIIEASNKVSCELCFESLDERAKARDIFVKNGIRYRTGKAIVPFRISGNVKWGIPIPKIEEIDGPEDLTFWVWPESLWAPISFTKAILNDGYNGNKWEKWWKSEESQVYQFIGEDNIYFYGIAEKGIFAAVDEELCDPIIIPNHHLLYGKSKASSSGSKKPPKANELLDYYTSDQLRLHFMNMCLGEKSVDFYSPVIAKDSGFDTVLYEGNLVTNVLNRIVRSCFYTIQKENDGVYPNLTVSSDIKAKSDEVILKYEKMMYELSFWKIFELLNTYIKETNKEWSAKCKTEDKNELLQLIVDTFHVVRVATTLFHPMVPVGCEMIREYLVVDERLWDWKYIFEPLSYFMEGVHQFKTLMPRVDFFSKNERQLNG